MQSTTSPVRRPLGQKDSNASLNTTFPRTDAKSHIRADGMLSPRAKAQKPVSTYAVPYASPRAGQKRRITEVDGVEDQDWANAYNPSQATELISGDESDTDEHDKSMLSNAASRYTADTSLMSTASQEQNSLEQHFELPQEEMSQQTLEKIHAIQLPQNTSQPALLADMVTNVGASQESGMSSLVDFYGSDASQSSQRPKVHSTEAAQNDVEESMEANSNDVHEDTTQPLTEEQQRRKMLDEKAAELRTRLQLAYFKVQTKQTHKPFSKLRVPDSMKRIGFPPTFNLVPPSSSTSTAKRIAQAENYISSMRARATAQTKPVYPSLQSLPMPNIQPTAYSARYAADTEAETRPRSTQSLSRSSSGTDHCSSETLQLPSSPPISRGHSLEFDDSQLLPRLQSQRTTWRPSQSHHGSDDSAAKLNSIEQLSSPPPSDDDSQRVDIDNKLAKITEHTPAGKGLLRVSENEKTLTSSVVKGEAASGLLQLMRGVGGGRGMCGI